MNIIIPLGGKGERFSKNGYTHPKPLIPIFDKCMIEYVLDHLSIQTEEDHLFIIYDSSLDTFAFSTYIHTKYPFVHFIQVNQTKGAVETLFMGIEYIFTHYSYHEKCLILDCDTFYTENIRDIFNDSPHNMVFYTQNEETTPIYSYIELNKDSFITNIKEKEKISDHANTGAYAFTDIKQLYHFCQHVLEQGITFNNEPYTSCVISEMINQHVLFKGYPLNQKFVFSLGTPYAVNQYMNNTYAFLFDLDGTLVITDDIYFDVWYEILAKYNIVLTKDIFTTFIQGNNDKYVLNTLLKNIDLSLSSLSIVKDELFIQHIHQIKIIDGVYDFIKQIKKFGHKMCIVTNCNRTVANEIIKYIHLDDSIDFIISNTDCIHGKPDQEPYKRAIERYNIHHDKCFIFEDSKSGLLSGKGVHPKMLIGLETIFTHDEMIQYGVDFSIKNYSGLLIDEFIYREPKHTMNQLKALLKKNNLLQDIQDIIIDDDKLKGGFIADVISFKTITKDKIYSQILKYENAEENNLSNMAKKLQLYEREYYFYTHLANKVNICIPHFYHLVWDNQDRPIGIVLENLMEKKYKVNLNVNAESIDVSLKIIDRMARMHSQFWNKDLKKLFPDLKGSSHELFCPFFSDFIHERYEIFTKKWFTILNTNQIKKCDEIYHEFTKIQTRFSIGNHLTFIHGDIKSPNIFYDIDNGFEPYFIDWQHCAIGKGVQDFVFFILESFEISQLTMVYEITKGYYYKKIIEYGVMNYSYEEFEMDIYDAICYIPFFTCIWFGTTPQDELIDKNFPYFLISKLFYLLEYVTNQK
jgi:HAD superfamily hydrolase (TIGR01509 family)